MSSARRSNSRTPLDWPELDHRTATYDLRIRELFRNSEQCQRLGKIEGIGPVPATGHVIFGGGACFAGILSLVLFHAEICK